MPIPVAHPLRRITHFLNMFKIDHSSVCENGNILSTVELASSFSEVDSR